MCLKSSKASLIQSKTEFFCWSIRPCVVWLLDLPSPCLHLSDFIPSLFPFPPHCSSKVLGTLSPWGPPLAASSAGKSFPYLCPAHSSLLMSLCSEATFSRRSIQIGPWKVQSLACYTPHPPHSVLLSFPVVVALLFFLTYFITYFNVF